MPPKETRHIYGRQAKPLAENHILQPVRRRYKHVEFSIHVPQREGLSRLKRPGHTTRERILNQHEQFIMTVTSTLQLTIQVALGRCPVPSSKIRHHVPPRQHRHLALSRHSPGRPLDLQVSTITTRPRLSCSRHRPPSSDDSELMQVTLASSQPRTQSHVLLARSMTANTGSRPNPQQRAARCCRGPAPSQRVAAAYYAAASLISCVSGACGTCAMGAEMRP